MKEDLLQFIWKFQYFNSNELRCTDGDKVQIIYCLLEIMKLDTLIL